jgi:hypothetical protein
MQVRCTTATPHTLSQFVSRSRGEEERQIVMYLPVASPHHASTPDQSGLYIDQSLSQSATTLSGPLFNPKKSSNVMPHCKLVCQLHPGQSLASGYPLSRPEAWRGASARCDGPHSSSAITAFYGLCVETGGFSSISLHQSWPRS